MTRFRALGAGAEVQPAVTEHRQRRLTFRSDVASAPPPETAAEPLQPACDPRRIPIRVVSRRAIEVLVENFNRSAIHAE